MNTSPPTMMYEWKDTPWKKIERNTFKLQKRIYQASSRGDIRKIRKLQRLLLKSRSAKLLAVRKVTQDNRGKKTAGVDGVKSLFPPERLHLSETLEINKEVNPLRRIWIPKPGTNEERGLAIPTMYDRALQSLVKSALEPEWEARFEANSYGFRPGRSAHDAIEAIFRAISSKAKWTLDADIAKCFDKIEHQALLEKVNTSPTIRRQIKDWLKAGVSNGENLFPTEEGVPQGGPISPLLMNIALHGLEKKIIEQFPRKGKINSPTVVRYADDLVVLHQDLSVIKQCQETISEWLREMGLELKPSKTRIVHTLEESATGVGFDFLGFNIRQYRVGKTKNRKNGKRLGYKTIIKPSKEAIRRHTQKLKETINNHKGSQQEKLIHNLNPIIVGWTNYYSTVVSKEIFGKIGTLLFAMLLAWGKSRHSNKGKQWVVGKYWRVDDGKGWIFQPRNNEHRLLRHNETPIRRHVKVKGNRSPFDGDWVYWSTRLGRHPGISPRVAKLLKKQEGRCQECRAFFKDGDVMEADHIIPKEQGGRDAYYNLQVLHRHCHDRKTSRDNQDERCE
jgi:RNA-directed DNA polymerase